MNPSYPEHEQLGYNANFEIALHLPFENLKTYCVSSDLFRSICSNQEFWRQRLQNDAPNAVQYKPNDMTYGQYYTALAENSIKTVYVLYNGRDIGSIPMFPTDTKDIDVYERALDLLHSKGINPNLITSDLFALKYPGGNAGLFRYDSLHEALSLYKTNFWDNFDIIDITSEKYSGIPMWNT
jgi:hypothetical protein